MTTSNRRASTGTVIAITALWTAIAVFGTWGMTASAQSSPRALTPHVLTFKNLKLLNGWSRYVGARVPAAAVDSNGIVHLKGEMRNSSKERLAFTLPAGMRPSAEIYVPVDLCNGYTGRLDIYSDGEANVETVGSKVVPFSEAECFTSLEGVSFVR